MSKAWTASSKGPTWLTSSYHIKMSLEAKCQLYRIWMSKNMFCHLKGRPGLRRGNLLSKSITHQQLYGRLKLGHLKMFELLVFPLGHKNPSIHEAILLWWTCSLVNGDNFKIHFIDMGPEASKLSVLCIPCQVFLLKSKLLLALCTTKQLQSQTQNKISYTKYST